ncbi:MAG TPA: mandelate racemase/muconate lactonizing enzyme family protein [Chloroflexota bacterium]|nr:mandelate racemase/muconate lactonizing enzyme family protein [Chloroflexota bacterium]
MKITAITAYAIKSGTRYELAGQARAAGQLPSSDYFRFEPYPQLYSQHTEAVIVRVETDEGITGWGEAQAPVGPEVVQTIIARVLGPAVLGLDPLETGLRYTQMYETMRVRGQFGGYQVDAMAAIDTALWDIRGKATGQPLSTLLGGRYRQRLPAYVSGLRSKLLEGRVEEAVGWIKKGMGVKTFLGFGVATDAQEVAAIRAAVGSDARLYVDAIWRYSVPEAVRLARALEQHGISFFEAPLAPEDVEGHARLAREVDVAVAVGEPVRTRYGFLPWLRHEALDVCQPDLMRNGVTETWGIAMLADTFNIPVALHTGASTVVGIAATWQVAAAVPNFLVQEFQPVMFETFRPWLTTPLDVAEGELVVPTGPGLGIEVDEERFRRDVASEVRIDTMS